MKTRKMMVHIVISVVGFTMMRLEKISREKLLVFFMG
jgi:hypothetical protein